MYEYWIKKHISGSQKFILSIGKDEGGTIWLQAGGQVLTNSSLFLTDMIGCQLWWIPNKMISIFSTWRSFFSHYFLISHVHLQYHSSFTIDCVSALLNWVSKTKVPAEKWYCINRDRVLYACNYEDKPIWLGLGSELSCSVNKGSLKKPYPVKS